MVLGQALAAASRLYYVRGAQPSLDGEDDADARFVAKVRRRFLGIDVLDGSGDVHEMRRLKDASEVASIERAVAITAKAVARVIDVLRPEMMESEIEGEITRVYRAAGAKHSFDPIVGAGRNALSLHYKENNGPIDDRALLLIDTGASIEDYCADISRTFPVGGRFTDRQREVYEAVLRAEKAAIEAAKPGVLMGDLHAIAWEEIDRAGLSEHFIHGLGHHIGLETHDVGDLYRPLQPGAVITVEPGVYIPDEGIGIRIEDDVLITESGCRVLSAAIPREADEIERAMAGA
jgi:Xaa-Pro aminopeptidase